MKIKPLDILFALKAINLVPGLKNNDRAVAAALLDHFNRKTEQCDPGLERIAKLLGISTRTVIRSLPRIEAAGLFCKDPLMPILRWMRQTERLIPSAESAVRQARTC